MTEAKKRALSIFISYAHMDEAPVRKLYKYLRDKGFDVWFDKEKLVGGQNWQLEIEKGLNKSDIILICLSKNSIEHPGVVQKEFKFALERALEMPEGSIFLIPVRLEQMDADNVPQKIQGLQWIDLFHSDGYRRLSMSLRARAEELDRLKVEEARVDETNPNLKPAVGQPSLEQLSDVNRIVLEGVPLGTAQQVARFRNAVSRRWDSLDPIMRAVYVALAGAILATLIGLCGTFGQPVVKQWVAVLLARSTPLPSPTPTVTLPPPPLINPPGPEITVEAGKIIAVRASAEGADKYEWTLMGKGQISASAGPAILYTAPDEGDTVAILTVTAYNAQGSSSPTSLIINVQQIATVRLDALAMPHPIVGKGYPESRIELDRGLNGCYPRMDCTKFTYKPGGEQGGVYWWPQSIGVIMDISCQTTGEWSSVYKWPRCIASIKTLTLDEIQKSIISTNVLEGGDFSEVHCLTFWARGDQGGEIVTFGVGGNGTLPEPRSLGKVTLKSSWRQYTIDLEGIEGLTNAIVLFHWDATDMDNPQGATFYLDDIQFEGTK